MAMGVGECGNGVDSACDHMYIPGKSHQSCSRLYKVPNFRHVSPPTCEPPTCDM